jgi:ribosomal protein S18 acetylase RimI-like enzyme
LGRAVRHPDLVARPLREDELPAFLERGRAEYRSQLVEFASMPPDEADAKVARDFVIGEQHVVLALEDGGRAVGSLWFGELRGRVWLYEVWVDPAERGKGYGRAAMHVLEEEVRRRGLRGIEFNVWAGNDVARALYRSLGYVEQAVSMTKELT